MKNKFAIATNGLTNLSQVKEAMIRLFEQEKTQLGNLRLGYVAGIIGSDGEEKVMENRNILREHTNNIRKVNNYPIFSATDVFENNDLWQTLDEIKLDNKSRRQAFILFWREILEKGGITDIFMTPRWEKSEGAIDEHETAKKQGIEIHYV